MRILGCLVAFITAFVALTIAPPPARSAGEECVIADPEDTSLNVRNAPGGKVVNRLRNGRKVVIQELGYDAKARPWANISGYYEGEWRDWGWVFHRYLDCGGTSDAMPEQKPGFPLVFTRAADVRPLGLVLAGYGPDGYTVKQFPNRCHYYGDGGNSVSFSQTLLRHYEARGFTQSSLCMALISGILFDPETGTRLPSYLVVDAKSLRQYGVAEAGVLSEELPLDVPACFARGVPYTDCTFNYHPKTGAKLSSDTREWYAATGRAVLAGLKLEIAGGRFAKECTCTEAENYERVCRVEKRGRCKDEQYVVDMLGIERVSFEVPEQAQIGLFDISPSLPLGFGYALYADGAAGPSGEVGSEKLVLAGKNRVTKAQIQSVLNARRQN